MPQLVIGILFVGRVAMATTAIISLCSNPVFRHGWNLTLDALKFDEDVPSKD